jgi:hypothetical protein
MHQVRALHKPPIQPADFKLELPFFFVNLDQEGKEKTMERPPTGVDLRGVERIPWLAANTKETVFSLAD